MVQTISTYTKQDVIAHAIMVPQLPVLRDIVLPTKLACTFTAWC